MTEVRVLTIRQPWASLVALGVKTVETRPMPTKYRGWVAIHAAAADTDRTILDPAIAPAWDRLGDFIGGNAPVRGAVVAVARLTDCLPIEANRTIGEWWEGERRRVLAVPLGGIVRICDVGDGCCEMLDPFPELPYGDFTPGRYGWLLDEVRPLATPIPWKGGQLPVTDPTPVETCPDCGGRSYQFAPMPNGGARAWRCRACDGAGVTPVEAP